MTLTFHIRITPKQFVEYSKASHKAGLPISKWLKQVADKHLELDPEQRAKNPLAPE